MTTRRPGSVPEAVDLVTIQHISLLLDGLEKASKAVKVKQQQRLSRRYFIDFFARFTNDDLTIQDSFTAFTLEVMLRLLCPCLDTSRKYGVREELLCRSLLDAVPSLSSRSVEIIKNWKNNGELLNENDGFMSYVEKTTGNLGTSVERAFLATFGHKESQRYPTLRRMASLLDELASLSDFTTEPIMKSTRSRQAILRDLFSNQDPSVCKWITRIILKNLLPIRFDWKQILGAFHPCSKQIFFMTSSLRETSLKLANLFQNKKYHLANMFDDEENGLKINLYKEALEYYCKPRLGTRIASMESIQCKSISHVYHDLHTLWKETTGFLCELKYDGERMQIHIDFNGFSSKSDYIRVYSKSGRDSTLDRIETHSIISRSLSRSKSMKNCILEAELVTFDRQCRKIQRFGGVSTFTRTKRPSSINSVNLYVVFFDILYINDQSLIGVPLLRRRQLLQDAIVPVQYESQLSEAVFYPMPSLSRTSWTLDTFKDLRLSFQKIKGNGEEGLMIKGVSCPYLPGKRANWMKMKPDFMAGLADEAEYVLIGAGWEPNPYLSAVAFEDCFGMNVFFVGVLLNQKEMELGVEAKPVFLILFSVENGFSCEELVTVASFMKTKRKAFNEKLKMKRIETEHYSFFCADNIAQMSYYFEEPICVTLKGSSYEDKMRMGRQNGDENRNALWVLRHPRVERIWLDKERDWKAATTFQELQEKGYQSECPTATSLNHLEESLLYFDAFYCAYKKLYIAPRTKTLENSTTTYNLFKDLNLNRLVNAYLIKKKDSEPKYSKMNLDFSVESQYEGSQISVEVLESACIVNPPNKLVLPDSAKCIGPQSVFTAAGWHCLAKQQHTHYPVYIFLDTGTDESNIMDALEGQKKIGECNDLKPIIVARHSLHVIASYDKVY